jgi:hypothetical protein
VRLIGNRQDLALALLGHDASWSGVPVILPVDPGRLIAQRG